MSRDEPQKNVWVKEARQKGVHIVWFHLPLKPLKLQTYRDIKHIGSHWGWGWGLREKWKEGLTKRHDESFDCDVGFFDIHVYNIHITVYKTLNICSLFYVNNISGKLLDISLGWVEAGCQNVEDFESQTEGRGWPWGYGKH